MPSTISSDGVEQAFSPTDSLKEERAVAQTTPLADMVKWLSSEVSNLMSWVRLPLSALPFHSVDQSMVPPNAVCLGRSRALLN